MGEKKVEKSRARLQTRQDMDKSKVRLQTRQEMLEQKCWGAPLISITLRVWGCEKIHINAELWL
jgi:hypothetical protein